jgi:hypothetical protein
MAEAFAERKLSANAGKSSPTISAKPDGVGGCIVSVDSKGRDIFVVDAHRGGKRFIVHADEKLTAFVELEAAIRAPKLLL